LHGIGPARGSGIVSSNNQAVLKDKSSAGQSLIAASQASSVHAKRDHASRNRMEHAMEPYEIRQNRDGSINYNDYYARPVSLLTPNMRRFSRRATSPKMLVLTVATIIALAVMPLFAGKRADRAELATNSQAKTVVTPR
jgi:hypothetical protein